MIYKKRAVGILGAPVGYAREGETIEGAQQAAQLERGQTVDVLAEARAAKAREFEVQLGYLTKKLDFIQVQALIGQALGGLGRLAKLTDSPDEAPLEGSLPVSMNLLAGGYFISRDADGDDWYLWQDVFGYWRVKLGEPVSDTDGQVIGPVEYYRVGCECLYKNSTVFSVTPGVLDIDGITKKNSETRDFTFSNVDALWEGPAHVNYSWYFLWAIPELDASFRVVCTRLSQPSGVTATVLTDATANWIPGKLIGSYLGIVNGIGSLNWYEILDNTISTIAIAAWVTPPLVTSYYMIRPVKLGRRGRLIGQLRSLSVVNPILGESVYSNYNPFFSEAGSGYVGVAGAPTKVNTVDAPFYVAHGGIVELEYRGGVRANNATTMLAYVEVQLTCDNLIAGTGYGDTATFYNYLFANYYEFPVRISSATRVGPGLHFVGVRLKRGYSPGSADPASMDWWASFGAILHGSNL